MQVAKRVLILYVLPLVNAWLVYRRKKYRQCKLQWEVAALQVVCTLENVLVGTRKTPPTQVAGDACPLQVQVKSLR